MIWPDTVELDGVSIPLAGILAQMDIHHGRTDIQDEPTATTCQLTLRDLTSAQVNAFDVGQTLTVTARDGAGAPFPRFTGRVTDARLEVDDLTVIAAGEVSRLRDYVIGEVNWPAETWTARVTRAFTEAGILDRLELEPDPAFNPLLAARDTETAGPTTLGDYLTFLVAMVGALVSDRLDGGVFVQAVGARTLEDAYTLDPADVAYAPAWVQDLPRGNIVKVRYQADQGESVTVEDATSVEIYGPRPETIDTSFVNASDATYRGNQRLGRAAYSHWNMTEAPTVRALELQLGQPILLDGMPAASPYQPWTPILEGWTDTLSGDTWTMTLAMSDPLLSGVALPWNTVPTTAVYHWNTVDTATDWTEALTLDALNAG